MKEGALRSTLMVDGEPYVIYFGTTLMLTSFASKPGTFSAKQQAWFGPEMMTCQYGCPEWSAPEMKRISSSAERLGTLFRHQNAHIMRMPVLDVTVQVKLQ